jgi:CheY-like chemotaxis protein
VKPLCPPHAKKRILIVDDEQSVRDLMGAMLRRIGYETELAESGAEALEKIAKADFDLVLTDLRMPEMAGDQLAVEIKKLKPRLTVGLVTGTIPEMTPAGVSFVLVKPFSLAGLAEVIAAGTLPSD